MRDDFKIRKVSTDETGKNHRWEFVVNGKIIALAPTQLDIYVNAMAYLVAVIDGLKEGKL